jgi:hypothetical protein
MHAEHADTYSDSADDIAIGIGTCDLVCTIPPWQKINSPAVDQLVLGQSCQLASENPIKSDCGMFCDCAI